MGIAKVKRLPSFFSNDSFPTSQRRLRFVNLVRRQAIEEIIFGIEGADMLQTEKLPAYPVAGHPIAERRPKLPGLFAARHRARARRLSFRGFSAMKTAGSDNACILHLG